MNKKTLIVLIVLAAASGGFFYAQNKTSTPPTTPTVQTTPIPTPVENLSYKGVEGKDALTLLKEKASVEQDTSGLVVSINGRKADSGNREYWAFYVNNQMAPVGPADYKTKNEDSIEWKIERY